MTILQKRDVSITVAGAASGRGLDDEGMSAIASMTSGNLSAKSWAFRVFSPDAAAVAVRQDAKTVMFYFMNPPSTHLVRCRQ